MVDDGLNYTCAIKIFQAAPGSCGSIDVASAPDFPPDRIVPGYLCQAARLLVGLTQQELHVMARVSKKSINDYENGFIAIRAALAERLVATLRGAGARFFAGENFVGVIVNAGSKIASKPGAPYEETEGQSREAAAPTRGTAPATLRPIAARRASPRTKA